MINDRFKIIKLIGEGRSKVFLCEDIEFPGKEFAIKCLPVNADEHEKQTFRDEYFILRKLDHPNIIKAYEIGIVVKSDDEDGVEVGSKFITLENFEAVELLDFEHIKNEESLKEIVKQLCTVLYYLHQSNFIYYDLKPENILIKGDADALQIKLIDLGMARFIPGSSDTSVRGSAQYIAPELLKKEAHDHRVDFYSLGIILYRIIYNRFPFDATEEIDIYKAQIGDEFDFPLTEEYSGQLINVVKKLLVKNPEERYSNSLQILNDLNIELAPEDYSNFIPAKIFSDREDAVSILTKYLSDKSSSELFDVKGFDGAGKSTVITRIFESNHNSILIENTQAKSGFDLIKYIVKKIIYSNRVYPLLSENEKKVIASFLNKGRKDFLGEIQSVFSSVTEKCDFILLIDDFNSFDNFTVEVLSELIPIFQVNGIKVIIVESSDLEYKSQKINNLRDVNIGSFTSNQLSNFVDLAFYSLFPKEQLKDLILNYADLLPGNIMDFIRDVILLNIIRFTPEGVLISEDSNELSILQGSLGAVYDLRLSKLSEQELYVAKVISAFDGSINLSVLEKLLQLERHQLFAIISRLQYHNIIQKFGSNTAPVITSDGLKKHIYSLIDNKAEFHSELANKITEEFPAFNRGELARQFELAGNYKSAYDVLTEELNSAEELSAFSYMRGILEHLLTMPLDEINKNYVKFRLVKTLSKLSDYNTALKIINEINSDILPKSELLELYILKGNALIGAGNIEEGKELLKTLIPKVNDEFKKNKLLVEIAYAKFDLNKFDEAAELCAELIEKENVSDEDKGRAYNLLGMCSYFKDNDLTKALEKITISLKYYKSVNLINKMASAEANLGVINNILGNYQKAEEHWEKAIKLNSSVGNLNQEGLLIINYGVYYFEKANFERAKNNYERALRIFSSLGNNTNIGITLSNMGEVFITTCEYQKAYDALTEAKEIFEKQKNIEELVPVLLLLGQYYMIFGMKDSLEELFNFFNSLLTGPEIKNIYENDLRFLGLMLSLTRNDNIKIDEINEIREYYREKDDIKNYTIITIIYLNYLLSSGLQNIVIEEIQKQENIEAFGKNNIIKAHREYLLGLTAKETGDDSLLPAIEYFENAYNLLKDESIVELTWKVLYELAVIYTERGKYREAKNMSIYARELINLIAEKIESPRFKRSYLQARERSTILEKLDQLQKVVKV